MNVGSEERYVGLESGTELFMMTILDSGYKLKHFKKKMSKMLWHLSCTMQETLF